MTLRSFRVLAVVLLCGVLSIAPIAMWLEHQPEPSTEPTAALMLVLLLLPALCLLLLVLLVRYLAKRMRPEPELAARLRRSTRLFGPFGCVWAVFVLTEEP